MSTITPRTIRRITEAEWATKVHHDYALGTMTEFPRALFATNAGTCLEPVIVQNAAGTSITKKQRIGDIVWDLVNGTWKETK